MRIEVRPADWDGFVAVMGEKGGCGGCWCMLWRLSRREMEAGKGAPNRAAMQGLFETGPAPGLIAWRGAEAVGWIQVDRRDAFARLATSRVLKPVDDRPVWSVACFLVTKHWRRTGVSRALLEAACALAQSRGAEVLEGYPIDTPNPKYVPAYAWTGFLGTFRDAGFEEVARHSPTRPIMRRILSQPA
ncbi:MAG: GNAT family N-acetyltransferase [Pseudomonadota bacterium]